MSDDSDAPIDIIRAIYTPLIRWYDNEIHIIEDTAAARDIVHDIQ